jgi:hypothetical protein
VPSRSRIWPCKTSFYIVKYTIDRVGFRIGGKIRDGIGNFLETTLEILLEITIKSARDSQD